MRTLRPFFLLTLAIVLSSSLGSATDVTALSNSSKVVLFRAGGAANGITQEQANTALTETARAMQVQEREIPRILVLYLSKDAADAMGSSASEARRNTSAAGVYYEVWLVEDAPLVDCARAMQSILEKHFEQTYTEQQRHTIIARVLRYVANTVSAKNYSR